MNKNSKPILTQRNFKKLHSLKSSLMLNKINRGLFILTLSSMLAFIPFSFIGCKGDNADTASKECNHNAAHEGHSKKTVQKPGPDTVISMLKEGNERFIKGKSSHPHTDSARLIQAGKESQNDHAYATVITCSDSRVPVERIFDAGVMDIFVIRVAGNVCDVDEAGSIEYGLAHVRTPVLVVLGHTQCGAVTAVTHAIQGKGHALERNIPPLVDNIEPAVRRAMKRHSNVHGDAIIHYGIEENVWQAIEDLFMNSPSTRNLVKKGNVKVVGAIYNVSAGKVKWLPSKKVDQILTKVESSPKRARNAMASGGH